MSDLPCTSLPAVRHSRWGYREAQGELPSTHLRYIDRAKKKIEKNADDTCQLVLKLYVTFTCV